MHHPYIKVDSQNTIQISYLIQLSIYCNPICNTHISKKLNDYILETEMQTGVIYPLLLLNHGYM